MRIKTSDNIHHSMGPFLLQRVAVRDLFWFREISEEYESGPPGIRLRGVHECVDDVLYHGKDQTEHDQRLEAVIMRLAGETLNLDKCQFSTDRVKFLGHVISSSGIEADPEKLQAIADLTPPQNVQEVRTFPGMMNQLSKFSDHLTDKTKSIRDLLHKGNQWTWGSEQKKAFEQIKSDLTRAPVLALYDPNKETKGQLMLHPLA